MTTPSAKAIDSLVSFYLGRHYDLDRGECEDDLLMYDAKDLCTHAMCVGMTGSGKTGLCISLLEEAALDGIPAICVDPKGDLANLMLTFPELRPEDFKEWLEESEATRKGITLDQLAAETAETWRAGLASWGQTPDRIRSLKNAVDVAIYTPGSNIGLPLTVLKSFDAPPPEARNDAELIGDRVTGAVSGLLTLMGIDADPMTSTEHILLSSILADQWKSGKNVGIGQLIRLIQTPPIKRVGVVDLDSFMSTSDRGKLAMRLNNLLASPAFASWLEGETLSIQRLLYTAEGKPRLTILSIAHLSDSERMFFVTILLNELIAWMRTQKGTSSLRALFYMDEIAGYFPPVSNPPSKPPMLTLLKQARAYGLGITLATQNPVDLDYKGLSNIGTWFLGRLQTERDKARVLEGLEGAASQAGSQFDRGKMERVLAGLGNRVFLMNNVHDDRPTVFQTRWAMSFLAGPLARRQISDLMAGRKAAAIASAAAKASADPRSAVSDVGAFSSEPDEATRPVVPVGVEERFVAINRRPADGAKLVYRPAVRGEGSLHFIRAAANLDVWRDDRRIDACHPVFPDELWENSEPVSDDVEWLEQPQDGFVFAKLPNELRSKGKFRSYKTQYKDFLYRQCSATLYKSPTVKGYAPFGDEAEAIAFFKHRTREQRDDAIEKLRDKFEKKIASLEKKIGTAENRVDREKGQSNTSMLSAGSSILGMLVGSFLGGRRTRMSTVARGVGYASQQGADVRRAESALKSLEDGKEKLDDELQQDLDELHDDYDLEKIDLQKIEIPPRKSDLNVDNPMIVWIPWQVDSQGAQTRLY